MTHNINCPDNLKVLTSNRWRRSHEANSSGEQDFKSTAVCFEVAIAEMVRDLKCVVL
jgi:hypothetical protein